LKVPKESRATKAIREILAIQDLKASKVKLELRVRLVPQVLLEQLDLLDPKV
jgi:hypothetical protein